MPRHQSRPVVALDFDGVLNPLTADPEPGYAPHDLHIPAADVPNSPFIRGFGKEDLDVTVNVHPAHGPWITSLLEWADVVWATTWEAAANQYLAPLLGIDPLPVGISVEQNQPRFGDVRNGNTGAWKAHALATNFARRPLIWVDDMAGYAGYYGESVSTTRHLTFTTDERLLRAARRHRWEDHEDYAPTAHYEDTWAASGKLVHTVWSTIADGSEFRSYTDSGGVVSPTTVINTAAEIGLTREHMEHVTRFVRAHASA